MKKTSKQNDNKPLFAFNKNQHINIELKKELKSQKPNDIEPFDYSVYDAIKKEKRSSYIRTSILLIFVCIFIGSFYTMIDTIVGYSKAEKIYVDLAEGEIDLSSTKYLIKNENNATPHFGTRIASTTGFSLDAATFERMISRIRTLQVINTDVLGWINIPGTKNINYPLMQYSDNDFYLNHDYQKNRLIAGSIFVDYRCSRDFNENHNTVIYGHNMQNNMMFSELIKYLDEDFFNENKYIYIYNEYGVYTYKIFAIFKTNYQYKYIDTGFETHKDFVDFAYEMKNNSIYQREDVEFDENSRIITLSTCTNVLQSERYCLQAVLVDAYNN